jgi:hypothetical protein
MGSILKLRSIAGSLAFLGVVGAAAAQTIQTATPPAPPAPEPQRDVALSPQQMLAEAKGFVPAMDRTASVVRRQLGEARDNRDVVRVLCLNDKLNQIDLAIRTANDRIDALGGAVAESDAVRAKHEFTVVQVLRERVITLGSEANQCVGEETGFMGDAKVKVDIDPSVPDTDPSEPPPEGPLVTEPPVLQSPTL